VDLLAIARKIRRYKLITLPIVALALLGVVYVVAVKKPVYEASSSYVLLNPPAPPTPEEVARNPELARINSNNPYTRFTDQAVVVEILASKMDSESARRELVKAGGDKRYEVAPSSQFGYSSPILQVTSMGWTPESAIRTAKLVGQEVTAELDRMQTAQGIDSRYRIDAREVDGPDHAELRASGQLRALVGVLVFGAVLLFMGVSAADALSALRRERVKRAAPSSLVPTGERWSAQDEPHEGLSDLEDEEWPALDEPSLRDNGTVALFPDLDPDATIPGNGRRGRHLRHRQQHGSSG
jgi:hypothetical protein